MIISGTIIITPTTINTIPTTTVTTTTTTTTTTTFNMANKLCISRNKVIRDEHSFDKDNRCIFCDFLSMGEEIHEEYCDINYKKPCSCDQIKIQENYPIIYSKIYLMKNN